MSDNNSEKTVRNVNESAHTVRLETKVTQDKPWRDAELINYLYHVKEMSGPEIAEKLGCSVKPIYDRIENTRSISEANRIWTWKLPPKMHTSQDGYERFKVKSNGGSVSFAHHRLIAVAEYGFDEVADKVVHHKKNIPWDNRPDNLELMDQSAHVREHLEEIPINDKLGMLEMSRDSPATHGQIAGAKDTPRSTVNSVIARAGGSNE